MIERCLVVGANGQLGRSLKSFVKGQFVDVDTVDITNPTSFSLIDWSRVDTIINAAAYTAVDQAETPEGRKAAWQINVLGVGNLVRLAIEKDLTLVHVSSDYVFDGQVEEHLEDEPFSPLNVYGATKAAGDALVQLAHRYYILRTSWVVGDGRNFVRTMVSLAEKGISPSVVNDQFGRLTFSDELSRAICHLISEKADYGTYNITNSGEVSTWADIAQFVFQIIGSKETVTSISTAEYNRDKQNIAPRPRHSTLALDKIIATGFNPEDWQKGLKRYLKR